MRQILLASMLVTAPLAEGRTVTADYWPNAPRNPYQAEPIIARRLRCAALIEAIGTIYFGAGLDVDPRLRGGLNQVSFDTPRMPPSDVRERQSYAQAAYALYDAAETLGRAKPKYTHVDFHGWYNDSNRLEALAKVRAGLGQAALASRVVRCFEYPQIAALQAQLAGRLRTPPLDRLPLTSPRIRREWMPLRTSGYFYQSEPNRYLTCAGIAQAAAEARFGPMPLPDGPAYVSAKPGGPDWQVLRKAVQDTYRAGTKFLAANNAAERQAYLLSFHVAARSGKDLVKNGVAGDAMREPTLRCAELAPMRPALSLIG